MVQIKFNSRDENIKGFYELITHGTVKSLPNGVYEISKELLKVLDEAGISYQVLTEGETINAHEAVRNSLTSKIQ